MFSTKPNKESEAKIASGDNNDSINATSDGLTVGITGIAGVSRIAVCVTHRGNSVFSGVSPAHARVLSAQLLAYADLFDGKNDTSENTARSNLGILEDRTQRDSTDVLKQAFVAMRTCRTGPDDQLSFNWDLMKRAVDATQAHLNALDARRRGRQSDAAEKQE